MSVASSRLVGLARQAEPARREEKPSPIPSANRDVYRSSGGERLEDSVLDLRGRAADEALDLTIAALDQAVLSGTPWLRLIHGHGTGRLKATLRDYLKGSPYVAQFRPGERGEGGDGVTIVELK